MSFTLAELRRRVEERDKKTAPPLVAQTVAFLKTPARGNDEDFEEADPEQDLIQAIDLLNEVGDLLEFIAGRQGIPGDVLVEVVSKRKEIQKFVLAVVAGEI